MNGPCCNCLKRHFLCHSNCEVYLLFKEKREIEKNKMYQYKEYISYRIEAISRMKKRKR